MSFVVSLFVFVSRLVELAKNGFSVLIKDSKQLGFLLIYFSSFVVSVVFIYEGTLLFYTYLKMADVWVDIKVESWVSPSIFCFDTISLGLVFMTVTIFPGCFLYVLNRPDRHLWALYLILTEILVLLAFVSLDLLFFFIMFESLIFPMYKMILGWGSKGDIRLTAARSFVIYTVLGSLLLLFTIIYLHSAFGSTSVAMLKNFNWDLPDFLLFVLFIAFATKVPTFPFYHWLTLAHVEASTVGSVILAALILKLGSYGFIRFLIPLYREHLAFYLWRHFAISLFIVSMLFAALAATVQTDMKRIVAYSSIEHINLAIIGLALCSTISVVGSYVIMLAHGWVAAGLFFAVGWVYDRRHQRDLLYYRGYAVIDGWWSIFFGLLLLANIGFPITLNFFGEFQILIDLFGQYTEMVVLVFFTIIANVVYTLKLGFIMWGSPYSYLFNGVQKSTVDRLFRVLILVLLLALPVLFIVIAGHPEYYPSVSILLEKTFSHWRIVSIQSTWPWSASKWLWV